MIAEKYVLDLIEGRRSSSLLRPLLAFSSVLYRLAVKWRHSAYENKWFPTLSVSTPTISIGNIVVGGTGKTPLVHLLANTLQQQGKIAILTRGFRSHAEKRKEPLHLVKGCRVSAEFCGDEPLFLAESTDASVWVGPDRALSAHRAKEEGAVCLILDDGLQHRRLHRDFEIITIDANDPFSKHRFLPYGLLRDLPERLQQADLIVASHTRDLAHYERVKKELSTYTQAPIVAMQHELIETPRLQGCCIGVFCGIGKPHYFIDSLKSQGAELVDTCILLDHQGISLEKLDEFVEKCSEKGAEWIACTEKDWVKLQQLEIEQRLKLPVFPVRVRLKILAGQEHWDSIIERIKQKIKDDI